MCEINIKPLTCSFVGLGLIGGSIARAFREFFPDMKIKVFDKDIPSLSLALKERVATSIHTEITADYVTQTIFSCVRRYLPMKTICALSNHC